MHVRGILFLVAGPSGAGKTTVLRHFLEGSHGIEKAISVTTRKPRPGETDGQDYLFWDPARFKQAAARGEFLEFAEVHGAGHYGTPRSFVEERLARGTDVIKDIDVQGVEQVRRVMPYPASVTVFVVPPTRADLAARLKHRGTENAQALARRLATAEEEVRRIVEYDYLVCNQDVGQAAEELRAIRKSEQLKRLRREEAFRLQWGGA